MTPHPQKHSLLNEKFNTDLEQFLLARTEAIHLEELSSEYTTLLQHVRHLEETLKKACPDAEITMQELNDTHSTMEAVANQILYRKGFSDGIKFIIQSLME